MGQDRHFFRVAIYGLEKGVIPEPGPEDVSLKISSYVRGGG